MIQVINSNKFDNTGLYAECRRVFVQENNIVNTDYNNHIKQTQSEEIKS